MPAIGYVTKQPYGSFKGQLRGLSIRAEIEIVANSRKASEVGPEDRLLTGGVEVGAGWVRHSETSRKDYVSLSLATLEFGPSRVTYPGAHRGQVAKAGRFRW